MSDRALRRIAAILAFSLYLTVTVNAGPVGMSGVRQVVGGGRSSGGTTSVRLSTQPSAEDHTSTSDDPNAKSDPQQEGPTVQTGEDIVVTQEDCDCEQPKIAGGFPKWPFLGLLAIPFFFIHHHKEDCRSTPCSETTPTPPSTPTPPVPEPTTLLLFGSGLLALGAGVRRRYKRDRDQSTENDKSQG